MRTGEKMPLQLKLDDAGHAVVQDGKPVYVNEDGKEIPYDVNQANNKIKELCNEAKTHREAKEAAEQKLRQFDGIEDPEAARKAIETCNNLDSKKLIDAGEVERVKAEINKAANAKIEEANKTIETIKQQLYDEKIGGSFARSNFIKDKLAIPADIAQAAFGKNFNVTDDGRIIAKDNNGNEIYSQINPGEPAAFDEALEILVGNYKNKDSILRSNQATGGGTTSGNAASKGIPATYAECKTPEERRLFIQTKAANN